MLSLLELPGVALPVYSRQFNVPCSTCHTVAPRLNRFGYAFQANHFNWPEGEGKQGEGKRQSVSRYLPFTALATLGYSHNLTEQHETASIQSVELFASSGLGINHGRQGGYFVNLTAAANDGSGGDLDNAFVALPLAGKRGQLAITLGQATALQYQYDPVNSLTDTLPYGFTEGVDNFAFGASTPMLKLDYFDHRGTMTADGNYVSIGVPFQGHLAFNRTLNLGSANGLFLHAFHRRGYGTLGILSYLHGESNTLGVIGTYGFHDRLYLTGLAMLAHQPGYNTTHTALEAEYLPSHLLGLSGRLEFIDGEQSDVASVAAINYYPTTNQYFRLSLESRQRRADRGIDLTLRLQY